MPCAEFGANGAVLQARCPAVGPTSLDVAASWAFLERQSSSVRVHLVGVPPSCAGLGLSTPCASVSAEYPPLFHCAWWQDGGDEIIQTDGRRASVSEEVDASGKETGAKQVFLVCPLPSTPHFATLAGVGTSEATLKLRVYHTVPFDGSSPRTAEIPFAGITGGNAVPVELSSGQPVVAASTGSGSSKQWVTLTTVGGSSSGDGDVVAINAQSGALQVPTLEASNVQVAETVKVGASSASTNYKLTITSNSANHLRLDNGAEAAFLRVLDDGSLDIWSHGNSANQITFRQGTGSGEEAMKLDSSGNLWTLGGFTFGSPTVGQTTFGVCQYFTGSGSTDYFHLKMPTPFNVDAATSDMYHIHITGYCLSERKILDLTFAGYRTPPSNGGPHSYFTNVDPLGTTSSRKAYHGSDGRLYLRFAVGNTYYCSFRADSMFVGNGYALSPGDVTVVKTSAADI